MKDYKESIKGMVRACHPQPCRTIDNDVFIIDVAIIDSYADYGSVDLRFLVKHFI